MTKRNIKSPSYWGEKTIELALAGATAFALIMFVDGQREAEKAEIKAEDWFRVNSIYVPDHEVGSDPLMIYDRDIFVDHRGFWVVEAQRQTTPGQAVFFNECSGSGVANYGATDHIPEDGVRWGWFFNRECAVPPGTYRIEMTKDLSVAGYPVKTMRPVYSNTFTVYPRGEFTSPGK